MVEKKRITAIKTEIGEILSGRFVKGEEFLSSYVLTRSGMRVSRARVLSTVVAKFISDDANYGSLTLDDGTGVIRAKAFSNLSVLDGIEIGDLVDVIGRIREYNGERYLLIEIVRRVENVNELLLRKLEVIKQSIEQQRKKRIISEFRETCADAEELKKVLKAKFNISGEEVDAILASEEMVPKTELDESKQKELVIELIKKFDTGEGCSYEKIIKESGLSETAVESIVNELLNSGVCFEPKPGVIKLL